MGIMNKEKGLRRLPYMKTDELIQWMKLGLLAGELEATVNATKDKAWHKKLKTACTLCAQVLMNRIDEVDPKQVNSIVRRRNHTKITLTTSDEARLPKGEEVQDEITIAYQDLLDLTDLALNSCAACPQGECVKDCFYRKVLHRLALPVARDDVKEGECEFNWQPVGEVSQVKPQNQRINNYYKEDYRL